ncbi:MAG: sulfite exporter TauE/SafE family protein, partial [Anaerolineaceae bacterium]|nr:sulfite exporter TauE/SafE family protein [Anaerolineaceae bacterium]
MVLWIIAAFVAAFIKGLCGVGDAPVFSAILSFANNNIDISPAAVLLSLPSNSLIVWKNRKSLNRRIWLPMALLLIAGTIPGTLLLKNVNTGTLKLVFGIFLVFVGILMIFNELNSRKVQPSKWLLLAVGIISGLSSGLFGIGVMLIVYITLTTEDMSSFKGNICAIFAAENVVRVVMYIILGLFTPAVIKRALLVFPLQVLGIYLGMKSASFLDERKAKLVVMSMLIVSGLALTIV